VGIKKIYNLELRTKKKLITLTKTKELAISAIECKKSCCIFSF